MPSVFEGELTKSQLQKLTVEFNNWIRDDKDSVIIFKNRNKNWLTKQFIGMDTSAATSNFFKIIGLSTCHSALLPRQMLKTLC
ncbi:CRISPR-associated endonuclease Cas2 [Liquorilactobacillus ghanensis]|uniref:CRISPR-associated endonuclease Cas2 n=1 Tax=Liquorilactobacillus ghanensis TaxID=399370 RepID=UPI00070EABE8